MVLVLITSDCGQRVLLTTFCLLLIDKGRDLHVSHTLSSGEGLVHLKIETRLKGERVESVQGEYTDDLETTCEESMFKLIRRVVSLVRIFPTSGFEL